MEVSVLMLLLGKREREEDVQPGLAAADQLH